MNRVFNDLALTAVAILAVASSAAAQEEVERPARVGVPVLFPGAEAESSEPATAFDPGEATLTGEHVGARATLFGKLDDTGELNLFSAFWHDGRRTSQRRYYVAERVYQRPHTSIWATVDATITKVDTQNDDKHEIRIHSVRGLTTEEVEALAQASARSRQWISDHLDNIDLNKFKKGRPKRFWVGEASWKRDFNQLDRRDDVQIRALDMKRGVVELLCSRHVIEEVPHHHGFYIDLIMVYDLKSDAPIRLLVRDGGYFLE